MNINYISAMDESFASYRYRMLIPGKELKRHGHTVGYSRFFRSGTDSVVFSKHFNYGELDIALLCQEAGQKVVFDICDDHFSNSHAAHYKAMAKMANVVTAATPEIADAVLENTGKAAIVISDPYELPEEKPVVPVIGEKLKLLWVGHPSNIDSLMKAWNELEGNLVQVITSPEAEKVLKRPIVPWSLENVKKGMKGADAVVIPSTGKARKLGKSPNRMVESIRQGKFVIANPIPAYEQFREWMWVGGIREGIEWLRENAKEVPERVRAAQKYVRENFSPEKIGSEWERALVA